MKRVAILNAFNPETYKGGIETFILNLKNLLSGYHVDIDIHYVYPQPTLLIQPFPLKSLHNGIPAVIRDCFMMGRAFSRIEKEYSLVITNNFYGAGYYSPKVKSINIYHSAHAGYADALKKVISKNDYRQLKYICGYAGDILSGRGKDKIAVSEGVRNELRKYYKFKDIKVIHHGIDTEFFKKIKDVAFLREKWDIPFDSFVGILVGRWEIGKGTDIIEEVMKLHPDIIWLLATGQTECPLEEHDNIKIVKDADNDTLREMYSLSDFMLFPSYYEGFGMVIIEAMACELPVISTKVGIVKNLWEERTLQKLILPACHKKELIEEINSRISFLKNEAHEREKIADIGREIIERDYRKDIWKKKMAQALRLL